MGSALTILFERRAGDDVAARATLDCRMKTRMINLWGKLIASYWFVPTLMCALAMIAATAALRFDGRDTGPDSLPWLKWASVNTTDGARELLSTIAGSMITVAGVVFSITVLALSFASAQYGPRLLRNFMRDRSSQFVLGAFLSTYLYCLLVLRTIGHDSAQPQLPHIAVAGALALGIGSMAVLIFFIHHVARLIQISTIVDAVGRDLTELIGNFERIAAQAGSPRETAASSRTAPNRHMVDSQETGYVQAVAYEDLLEIASAGDALLEMHIAPGDYVSAGLPLGTLHTASSEPAPGDIKSIRAAIVIGLQRTNEQDLEFPIDQLAEIAVRALSPGVNDPFTAVLCINRLGAALRVLAGFRWPPSTLYDEAGCERVRLLPTCLDRLLHRAFSQILHHGGSNPAIARQILKMLGQICDVATAIHAAAIDAYADEVLAHLTRTGVVEHNHGLRDQHEQIKKRVASRS